MRPPVTPGWRSWGYIEMCLITYAPRGAQSLDWATLMYSNKQNGDGFGLAYFDIETKHWEVRKSKRSHVIRRVVDMIPQDAPLVLHQRYATHGTISLDNTHPFPIGNKALLFHNGCISGTRAESKRVWVSGVGKDIKGQYQYTKPEISDTRAFVEDELMPLVESAGLSWLRHPKGVVSLENRVGSGSVLAITIPGHAFPVLVNEDRGDWVGDLYYSNSYSRPGMGYGRTSAYADWDEYDWAKAGYVIEGAAAEADDEDDEDWEDDWDKYLERQNQAYADTKLKRRGGGWDW